MMIRMSRKLVSERDVERVEKSGRDRPETVARQLEEWAASVHPDDWMNTASLLVRASELWLLATDHERALSAIRRAVDTGEPVPPDVRCYLVACFLATGQLQEADSLAAELKRSRASDLNIYEFLGDSYYAHGQPPARASLVHHGRGPRESSPH